MKTNKFNTELTAINQKVIIQKNYENFHVAKLDNNGNIIDVYKNRNQAVRHYFQKKGFNKNNIILKYLQWNGALQQKMFAGMIWQGFYYMYVPKEQFPITIQMNGNFGIPVESIVVDTKGVEKQFSSVTQIAMTYNIPLSTIHKYADTGKSYNGLSFYRKNKNIKFKSKKDAMRYFRIGKDKFKKLYESDSLIRGQKVSLNNSCKKKTI